MTDHPNAMVPSPNWGEAARAFSEALPQGAQQVLLCAYCVIQRRDETPARVVIIDGKSLCPDHAREALGRDDDA